MFRLQYRSAKAGTDGICTAQLYPWPLTRVVGVSDCALAELSLGYFKKRRLWIISLENTPIAAFDDEYL